MVLRDRVTTFLKTCAGADGEAVALRTLTLHMIEALAPKAFAEHGLKAHLDLGLEACAHVAYPLQGKPHPEALGAAVDAWFLRAYRGLSHRAPDATDFGAALRSIDHDGFGIYAWLIGEMAARLGVDQRLKFASPRPFRHVSCTHDAYFLTHLVMLDTDFFARPVSHPEREDWADELAELVPWLTSRPNADLAAEVAICLKVLKRDPAAALALIPHETDDNSHHQATALLALCVE